MRDWEGFRGTCLSNWERFMECVCETGKDLEEIVSVNRKHIAVTFVCDWGGHWKKVFVRMGRILQERVAEWGG